MIPVPFRMTSPEYSGVKGEPSSCVNWVDAFSNDIGNASFGRCGLETKNPETAQCAVVSTSPSHRVVYSPPGNGLTNPFCFLYVDAC